VKPERNNDPHGSLKSVAGSGNHHPQFYHNKTLHKNGWCKQHQPFSFTCQQRQIGVFFFL